MWGANCAPTKVSIEKSLCIIHSPEDSLHHACMDIEVAAPAPVCGLLPPALAPSHIAPTPALLSQPCRLRRLRTQPLRHDGGVSRCAPQHRYAGRRPGLRGRCHKETADEALWEPLRSLSSRSLAGYTACGHRHSGTTAASPSARHSTAMPGVNRAYEDTATRSRPTRPYGPPPSSPSLGGGGWGNISREMREDWLEHRRFARVRTTVAISL